MKCLGTVLRLLRREQITLKGHFNQLMNFRENISVQRRESYVLQTENVSWKRRCIQRRRMALKIRRFSTIQNNGKRLLNVSQRQSTLLHPRVPWTAEKRHNKTRKLSIFGRRCSVPTMGAELVWNVNYTVLSDDMLPIDK